MEIKSNILTMTKEEIAELYNEIGQRHQVRESDLNQKSLRAILENLDPSSKSLLEVGCGSGHFLKQIDRLRYQLTGCDILNDFSIEGARYVKADAEALPFLDHEFDIVVCNHVLEHVVNIGRAIEELKRVVKKQLIVTVPCQRYFRYTMDLHVHFFSKPEQLKEAIGIPRHSCVTLDGDFVYIGYP